MLLCWVNWANRKYCARFSLLCLIRYSSLHKTDPSRWCKLVYERDKIEGKGNSPAVWCQKLWVNKIIFLHLYHNCHVFPSNWMFFTQNSTVLKSVYCAQPAEILSFTDYVYKYKSKLLHGYIYIYIYIWLIVIVKTTHMSTWAIGSASNCHLNFFRVDPKVPSNCWWCPVPARL